MTSANHDPEIHRLGALRACAVLDTPPEQAFDDLTFVAAQSCETPMAVVSLLDERRQWFKSRFGISLRETPREWAFCAHAGPSRDVFIVGDMSKDERFAGNPLVAGEPHILFHAGAPIVSHSGHVLGAVCVMDTQPRDLTSAQKELLAALARQAGALLDLRVKSSELAAETARRKAAESTLASVRQHDQEDLMDSLTGDFTFAVDGTIEACNPAFASLFGFESPEAATGTSFHPLHTDVSRHLGLVEALQKQPSLRHQELAMKRRDGVDLQVIANFTADYADDGALARVRGHVFDITAFRETEQELRHVQKLEAIGRLAGGIAHDFNNILTIIQGHATFLSSSAMNVQGRDSLRQIQAAAERGSSLTRQLLAFSRKQRMHPEPIDLNTIVDGMTGMMQRTLGEDVHLEVLLSDAIPAVMADSGMVEQVILNLLVNARDAMPKGGRLSIETHCLNLRKPWVYCGAELPVGRYVSLDVSDTGCGMTPEVQKRIFEPFFTTKGPERGTGLGLATVYGIVRQHGGWIRVTSELDQGTTFEILFPATDAMAETGKNEREDAPVRGGTETILLVEDEPELRRLVGMSLERYGYHVLDAASGPAALKVWHEHGNAINLVISDLVLPDGMSGMELAANLRAIRPDLKITFSSGYSAEAVAGKLHLVEGLNFLQKPYTPRRLARTVRACLDCETALPLTPPAEQA